MTIAYSGTSITYPDNSTQASAQIGMKNRIINGGFTINQVGYVSGTALAASAYPHDMYKAGASGGTYTFTQGTTGVNTTITITAGSLIQIIEGVNLPEGGTYVLSWTGTAQARLNNGAFGSSGTVTVTGWVAGTNLPVEFNTGTVGSVQLEVGSVSTTFDYRPYGFEFSLCQRYYETATLYAAGYGIAGGAVSVFSLFSVVKRVSPTVTTSDVSNANTGAGTGVNNITSASIELETSSTNTSSFRFARLFTASARL
jgi:hypothetical protein